MRETRKKRRCPDCDVPLERSEGNYWENAGWWCPDCGEGELDECQPIFGGIDDYSDADPGL